jgi:hypothetical protein
LKNAAVKIGSAVGNVDGAAHIALQKEEQSEGRTQ